MLRYPTCQPMETDMILILLAAFLLFVIVWPEAAMYLIYVLAIGAAIVTVFLLMLIVPPS